MKTLTSEINAAMKTIATQSGVPAATETTRLIQHKQPIVKSGFGQAIKRRGQARPKKDYNRKKRQSGQ